jgi:hypothetical protein
MERLFGRLEFFLCRIGHAEELVRTGAGWLIADGLLELSFGGGKILSAESLKAAFKGGIRLRKDRCQHKPGRNRRMHGARVSHLPQETLVAYPLTSAARATDRVSAPSRGGRRPQLFSPANSESEREENARSHYSGQYSAPSGLPFRHSSNRATGNKAGQDSATLGFFHRSSSGSRYCSKASSAAGALGSGDRTSSRDATARELPPGCNL